MVGVKDIPKTYFEGDKPKEKKFLLIILIQN